MMRVKSLSVKVTAEDHSSSESSAESSMGDESQEFTSEDLFSSGIDVSDDSISGEVNSLNQFTSQDGEDSLYIPSLESDSMEKEDSFPVEDQDEEFTSMESDSIEEKNFSLIESPMEDESEEFTSGDLSSQNMESDSIEESSSSWWHSSAQNKHNSNDMQIDSMKELSSSDGLRSSSMQDNFSSSDMKNSWERTSSSDDSSSRSESSSSSSSSSSFAVGATLEESESSSDDPCEKEEKGWFQGWFYKSLIITLVVFLAIIACLVIMELKRKRDKGRRSMRVQMLTSGGLSNAPAIKYLYKDRKSPKHDEDGLDYKKFTNLV